MMVEVSGGKQVKNGLITPGPMHSHGHFSRYRSLKNIRIVMLYSFNIYKSHKNCGS